MRIQVVAAIIGVITRYFALAFVLPVALAAWDGAWWSVIAFASSAAFAGALGTLASWRFTPPKTFYREEALAIVAGTWVAIAVMGAVPYSMLGLSIPDAMFESMSGFTTTGATILTDFSLYDRSFFLWRAMTQWFGGLGVIALFVVVLPALGIAGRQLFFAEASYTSGESVAPRVRQAASRVWTLYCMLTAVCCASLMVTGFPLYEAFVHSLTTLAAGGFSPNGESIAGYANPSAEWVLVVFMFLAGASFPLQVRVFTKGPRALLKDDEFYFYALVCGGGALAIAALLTGGVPSFESLRHGAFQSSSLISSTGFASTDFDKWSLATKMVLIVVMVIGGCAGSAAGGPKAIRHLLAGRHIVREFRQVLHPRAVLPVVYSGRGLPDQAMRAVFTLVLLYAGGYFVIGAILVAGGMTPMDGFSASVACLSNIGPGFGVVGPMGSFGTLPSWMKVLLTVAMWIGRLEILTVLALLHPDAWYRVRLRQSA